MDLYEVASRVCVCGEIWLMNLERLRDTIGVGGALL